MQVVGNMYSNKSRTRIPASVGAMNWIVVGHMHNGLHAEQHTNLSAIFVSRIKQLGSFRCDAHSNGFSSGRTLPTLPLRRRTTHLCWMQSQGATKRQDLVYFHRPPPSHSLRAQQESLCRRRSSFVLVRSLLVTFNRVAICVCTLWFKWSQEDFTVKLALVSCARLAT